MPLFTWNDNFSVKVKQFDSEHRRLFDIVNQLHDAMKRGEGKKVVGEVVAGLTDYTKKHFAAEEHLMRQHQFPFYEEHKKQHNQLIMEVQDLSRRLEEGKAVLTQEIMTFLSNWLTNHIQGMDKKYGEYFNSRGIL